MSVSTAVLNTKFFFSSNQQAYHYELIYSSQEVSKITHTQILEQENQQIKGSIHFEACHLQKSKETYIFFSQNLIKLNGKIICWLVNFERKSTLKILI